MATATASPATGKPLHVIPYTDKTKKWYEENARYYIAKAKFGGKDTNTARDLKLLYEIYNSQFPSKWFSHITDPLSATQEAHKKFPAKIRPVTILRTNIDLLLGEYPRRPFVYNVENLGDTGYNQFTENLKQAIHANLTEHFIQAALQQAQAQGQPLTPEQMQKLQQSPPLPEEVKTEFHMTYRDAIAVKGQKWLRRTLREHGIKRKFHKMFKDWLIAGETYSYKGVRNDTLVYRRVSPLDIDYDRSTESDMIEDGEWVVERRMLTGSEVTDEFYMKLKESEVKELDANGKYNYSSPTAFYSSVHGLYTDRSDAGTIPVYHVQFKGKKMVKFLTYIDPETFQEVEDQVDEDFDERLLGIEGLKVEKRWVNEVYEVTQIGDDLIVDYGPAEVQRNEMNNISVCKLNYNGRRYSDTHAANISVLEMGIPFQIMHIITTYILEKTIAKSKGKIVLLDKNTVPNGSEGSEEWDEEKTFYYAEAMGYMLIDRNQIGVDKSWNQYQVLDMSLFEQIQQLIQLKESFKQEWDDCIGISRQRKAQTMASDGVGNNERAVFQSTVITDMIFIGFEEFQERELQGLMEFGKFLTSKGHRAVYTEDAMETQVLEIEPGDFINEDLGVFVDGSSEHMEKLRKMQDFAQAMLQNNSKPSTIMEVIDSINAADLKAKLKRIEEIEQEIAESQADNESARAAELQEIAERHAEYLEILKRGTMHEEFDRKEDIEYIRGSFNTFTFADGDSNDNGVPDATEVADMQNKRAQIDQAWAKMKSESAAKQQELALKATKLAEDIAVKRKQLEQTDKKLKIDAKKAAQRPKATKK